MAGGVDSPIAPDTKGFEVMTVCTKEWNDEPERDAGRFQDRSGMLSARLRGFVLESLDEQLLGRTYYAEIAGYGVSCTLITRRLKKTGWNGPCESLQLGCGLTPEDVDYVNLHATSTQLNDRIETQAVKLAFGDHAYKMPMSGTKSQIGHPQGATGAAGIAATLLAMNEDVLPPTINLDEPDPSCDLDYVPNKSRQGNVDIALCNCIGFGSKNSALVMKKVHVN